MHVVICGGGVIGACVAYFLSCRGIDVTVPNVIAGDWGYRPHDRL